MGGERATGTATVLFTDLADSTGLMARLGDGRFDAVRTDHFDRLGAVVAACDGAVVKNTGDGILATFASAVAALKAAVGLQQATRSQAERDELQLSLRVGLAVGEVSFDDGDVFGTPVVEAARLAAAASADQILCTALVRAIAGSRAGHTFVDRGPTELKGLPDPVDVCEVEWSPADAAPPIALPSLLTGAGRIFVGRAEYLDRLLQRWKEALAGERRLVLLGGEPGVGKTRLATALAHQLYGEGAVVLGGRCDEDLGVPYQPMVEALRHYVTAAPAPRLGRHRGELARLVPELTEFVAGLAEPLRSDPETERYRLFDAVAAWLSDVSSDRPVLLVVDDVHWAAKPTLLLLRHVLRSAEPLRLLVVATYRDSDVGRSHPLADLLADLPRLDGAEKLLLSGLDVPEVATFIERAAGHELDEDGTELARAVWRETEGNAFFVVEVLRHLAESGAIEQREGRWVLARTVGDLGVPEGVRDVVGRRLSRLSDEANRVLACASVVGLEFDPAIVGTASGAPEDLVLAALEQAIAARLVVEVAGPVPRNRFSHALVRATLYDELSAARRVALHRKVAEAIEALHGDHLDDHFPALAHHWGRASAPAAETGRAVEYAQRAGDRALAQFANDEAAIYFRDALDLLDVAQVVSDDPRRLPLLISLGEAQQRAGDVAHRETLLAAADMARRLGDHELLAHAALANSRGFIASVAGTVDTERVAALEAAAATLPPDDSALRARVLSTLALELTFDADWDRRLSLSDEAVAMARRVGDPNALAHVLATRCSATLRPDTLLLRLADTSDLVAIVPGLDDPAQRSRALLTAFRTMVSAGRLDLAKPHLEAFDDLAADLALPALQWMAINLRVGQAMISGRLEAAEQLTIEGSKLGQLAGQREATWASVMQLFLIRTEQGGIDDVVREALDEVATDFARAGGRLNVIDSVVALVAAALGRVSEAQTGLAQTLDRPLTADYFTVFGEVLLSQLAVRLEDTAGAEQMYRRLRPYTEWVVPFHTFPTPSVSFHLGLLAGFLGRRDDAEHHFTVAAGEHERIGAPTYLARTRLEWARMLLTFGTPGDEGRAHAMLGAASATARELGLLGVERDATALLGR